jgi:hypothetical protein
MGVNHVLILAAMCVGLGTMIAGLPDWHDATHPAFAAGVLLQIGAVLKALYTPPPSPPTSADED